jgi:hypothetical protein
MSQGAGRRVADDRSRSGARSWVESVGRVLRQPRLRRVLPAMLVSAVGDGMSMVAVAWLAVQIAPPDPVDVHAGGSRGGPGPGRRPGHIGRSRLGDRCRRGELRGPGGELHISERTIDTHRAHIMRKLRLETRAELVLFALANGLIGAA